jgi:sugar phosphate isomerase/epimerase
VEFFGRFTHTAQEIKAALDETGLVCVGWHTPHNKVFPIDAADMLMSTITYNKILGNAEIVIPWIPEEMRNSKETWISTAKTFNLAAEKLAEYGMKLAYHNHSEEFQKVDGEIPIYWFFDNCPLVGVQLDNGNALAAGTDSDIYEPLTRYFGRVRTVHHKPYSHKNGFATMIGKDDIDWGKFFKLCHEHQNVDWHITEYECEEMYGQLEGVELCIKALREMEEI